MSTIDRYILKGLISPFAMSISGFLVIALSGELYNLMSLIIEKNVPIADVGRLLAYRLPDLLVTAIPIAILFSILMDLGRMSRDSELAVIFISGRSIFRLIVPIIVLGIICSVGVYEINERVVPEANHRASQIVRELILKDVMSPAEQEVFFKGTGNRYFYLGYVNKSTMEVRDVMVFEVSGAKPSTVIFAETGRIAPKKWTLKNGVIQEMDKDGITVSQTRFDEMDYKVEDEISTFVGEQRTAMEMSRAELVHLINLYKSSGIDMTSFRVDYQFKLALPFACLVFSLVGSAFSLGARRNGRFYSVAISVGLAFVYYLSSALFKSLGNMGTLPPLVSAWTANGIFLLIGAAVIFRGDRSA